MNEKIHEANDTDLKDTVIQVTGLEAESRSVELIVNTFKNLRTFANFNEIDKEAEEVPQVAATPEMKSLPHIQSHEGNNHLKFSYTIYLNLPNTNDISVFNAIFKSLRDNLLSE